MISGIVILSIIAFCSAGALYFGTRKKVKHALFLVLILGLSLRVFMSLDGFLHPWDERYHALVAKNLIDEPFKPMLLKNPPKNYDYRNWTNNHIWLHKPPLTLWIIAGSLKIFGINAFSVRVPSILFSTLSVWLIFILGKRLFNPTIGLLGAYFYAINGFLLDQSSGRAASDHIDTAFLFFTLLTIVLILTSPKEGYRNYIIGGVVFGLALLTKSLIAGLLPLIALASNVNNLRSARIMLVTYRLLWFIGLGAMFFLPWQLYAHYKFPLESAFEQQYNLLHLTQALENHDEPWYYYLIILRLFYNEVIYAPLIYLIYVSLKEFKQRNLVFSIWIFVPIIVFSLSATKMPGYLNIAAPAIFLVLGWFLYDVLKWVPKRWLSGLILITVAALSIRFSIENVDPFMSEKQRNPDWSINVKAGKKVVGHEIEYLFYNEH